LLLLGVGLIGKTEIAALAGHDGLRVGELCLPQLFVPQVKPTPEAWRDLCYDGAAVGMIHDWRSFSARRSSAYFDSQRSPWQLNINS
jgi:hypothetical protein